MADSSRVVDNTNDAESGTIEHVPTVDKRGGDAVKSADKGQNKRWMARLQIRNERQARLAARAPTSNECLQTTKPGAYHSDSFCNGDDDVEESRENNDTTEDPTMESGSGTIPNGSGLVVATAVVADPPLHRSRRLLLGVGCLFLVVVALSVLTTLLVTNGNDGSRDNKMKAQDPMDHNDNETEDMDTPTPSSMVTLPPTFSGGSWNPIGEIIGESAGDESSWSISLSADGNILAIGAPYNSDGGFRSGHVRVFERNDGDWTQRGGDIDGEAPEDWSGFSVSLSSDGNILAVGAPQNDGSGNRSGHVRVYEYIGNEWTQRGEDIDGMAAFDSSGWSLSLSSDGNVVAIGALGNDDNGNESGHVRVFGYNQSIWTQLGGDIRGKSDEDQSGESVSLSSDGNVVAIGARFNGYKGRRSGHVQVHEFVEGIWTQRGGDIYGEAAGDQSGYSVSLSSDGNVVAIGAFGNDDNGEESGHVHVYEYAEDEWTQRGGDIDGKLAGDKSGSSVSLSSDGNIVAIGSPGNDSNGVDSGHVRVFKYSEGLWVQNGDDIDGESSGDQSGTYLSLSSDGSVLAIGALWNDDNGDRSGHVRVYRFE